jgi:ribosomal protein L11 methyltransferase
MYVNHRLESCRLLFFVRVVQSAHDSRRWVVANGYVEVTVVATQDTEEALCDFLFSEGAGGLVTEEVPGEPLRIAIRASFAGRVPIVPLVEGLTRYQGELAALGFSGATGPVDVRQIPIQDWGRIWKEHFKPLPVGTHLVIAPPWEHGPFPGGRLLIWIDPAMAFGTGHHATTRMCLEALEAFMDQWPGSRGPVVLDVGTGTGILAIAAASLGAHRVVAIDTDPEACEAARKNLALHECAGRVQVLTGGLEILAPDQRFDLILANLDARILPPLFHVLQKRLAPGGRLIAGGILLGEAETLVAAALAAAFRIVDRRTEGEWLCLTLSAESAEA